MIGALFNKAEKEREIAHIPGFVSFIILILLGAVSLFPFSPAKLFICEPRKTFLDEESFLLGLFSPKDISGELRIYAQASGTSHHHLLLREKIRIGKGETAILRMPAHCLKPGVYHLFAEMDKELIGEEELTIVPSLSSTHFLIGSSASPEENREIGANLAPLDLYNYAKLDGEGNFLPDPLTPSLFEIGAERLLKNGLKGFVWQGLWSGYVLHQPFEAMASFLDPDIRKTAMQRAEIGAQQARRYKNIIVSFGGMDEPGLNYGIVKEGRFAGRLLSLFPDSFLRSTYEKLTKSSLPSDPRELPQDEWLLWMLWRANIMGDFFKEAREHIKRVAPDLPWGQDIYASFAINDGTNPFAQRLNDVPTTHSFMFWRGVAEQSWSFALERVGRRDTRFHFASNTTYFVPNSPDEASLAEVVTNYAVMDGVGMLWHLNFQKAKNLQPSIERIKRLGDFILATLPERHPVCVLYSFTESAMRLKEAGEISNEEIYRIPRDYAYECFALYHAIRRAGYSADLIHEWELRENGLRGRKILFLVGIKHPLPKDIVHKLEDFTRSGGKLFCDASTQWLPPKLEVQKIPIDTSTYPHRIEEIENNAQKLLENGEYLEASKLMRQAISDSYLDEYAQILCPYLTYALGKPEIEVSEKGIIPGKWKGGEGRYYLLLNDKQKTLSERIEREVESKRVALYPASDWDELKGVSVRLNNLRKDEAVYILEGKDWTRTKELFLKPGQSFSLNFEPTEMKVIAVLPTAIERLSGSAKMVDKAGRFIEIQASCFGKGNRLLSAPLPLEVTITDPLGNSNQIWRSTNPKGIYRERIPLASNDASGKWKVIIRELFSGKKEEIEVEVPPPPPIQLEPVNDIILYDLPAIRSLLNSKKEIVVVVGDNATAEEKEIAKELFEGLRKKGVPAQLKEERFIWKRGRYPKVFPAVERRGEKWYELTSEEREKRRKSWVKLRVWAGENGYPPTLPDAFEVKENLILVGTDQSSLLIKALQRASILPIVANDYFPGKGKGIVEYAWSPFSLGKDVILVIGSEKEGVIKAGKKLLSLMR